MNKDINHTLMAIVPMLRMNGEKITSIEAVEDWYLADGQEHMKEVAEITYENGRRIYADIGCGSNLTAVYDVVAVIQELKPRSSAIQRIVRGVYELPPAQPNVHVLPKNADCIYRQAAIDINEYYHGQMPNKVNYEIYKKLKQLPPAEPQRKIVDYSTVAMRISHASAYSILATFQFVKIAKMCGFVFCENVPDTNVGELHFKHHGTSEEVRK